MDAYSFDGKGFAHDKEVKLKKRVETLRKQGVRPKLAAILVGNDAASKIYVGLKKKAAERVGITLQLVELEQASKQQLLHLIKELNTDDTVHGIMVQLPLPGRLNTQKTKDLILNTIKPEKDVDGLGGNTHYLPAAVKAVLYSIKVAQKLGFAPKNLKKAKICVVGASGVVGKGVVRGLGRRGLKSVKADVKTRNLAGKTRQADVVFSATGVPGLIKGDMVKPGAVAIDVGAPMGDVDFESVKNVASFITPVPGGIGPVTVISLLENVVESCYNTRQYTHSGRDS